MDRPEHPRSAGAVFAEAFGRCERRIRRLVAGLGFADGDADDIVQDVFVAAAERPGQWRGEAETERWLLKVASNRCMLEYRRRARYRRTAREVLERAQRGRRAEEGDGAGVDGGGRGAEPASRAAGRVEEAERVRAALAGLEPELALPLALRYHCELNATQIGELLELPAGTVRSRLHQARRRLAEALGGEFGDERRAACNGRGVDRAGG